MQKSDKRYRKASLTTVLNVCAQAIQILTGLLTVPLTLSYLGPERFGLWMSLSAALMFLVFSDFGVGIGAQDKISRYLGTNEYLKARQCFWSALALMSAVALILMAISVLATSKLNISELLSLQSQTAKDEIVATARAVAAVLCLGIVAGIVQRAFSAAQEGFYIAVIQIAARLASLLLLILAVKFDLGLPVLVLVVGGMASLFVVLFGLPWLCYRQAWIRLGRGEYLKNFNISAIKDVLGVGYLGLAASLAIYLVNNSPIVLISKVFGAEATVDYAVVMKLIGVPSILLTYITLPIWPAITEAKVKGENSWIRIAYLRCAKFTVAFSLVSGLGIFLFGGFVVQLWTSSAGSVIPSKNLLLACIFFMTMGYWNSLNSMILNGLSLYKGQATYGVVIAIIFVAAASLVGNDMPKENIVWIISAGYFLRCLLMQVEVYKFFSNAADEIK